MAGRKSTINDKAGRPKIAIDWDKVENLLKAGCNGMQVSAYLGIHEDTLYNQTQDKFGILFSDYSAKMRAKGDTLLHNKQFSVAMEGDKTMLVWLGKQRLGQRDKFDHDHTTKGEKMILGLPISQFFTGNHDESDLPSDTEATGVSQE